jgi:ABC-type Fe3+ transport system permease subunit
VLALWPRWFAIEWAVAMLIGGIAALYGIIRGAFPATEKQRQVARLIEWVGYVCLAAAGLVFGLTSLIVFGWASLRASVLFLVIAACKLIRLLLAYVAREEVLRRFDEGGRR